MQGKINIGAQAPGPQMKMGPVLPESHEQITTDKTLGSLLLSSHLYKWCNEEVKTPFSATDQVLWVLQSDWWAWNQIGNSKLP